MKIRIDHNDLGDIEINSYLPKDVNDLIGTIARDYCMYSFYYADITINENETITIRNLRVIKAESVNVGFYEKQGISKNYINVYKNIILNKKIVCYPKSIISISYQGLLDN